LITLAQESSSTGEAETIQGEYVQKEEPKSPYGEGKYPVQSRYKGLAKSALPVL
jgi:hypothetical protein